MKKIKNIPFSILASSLIALWILFVQISSALAGEYQYSATEIIQWLFAISGVGLLLKSRVAYYCFLLSLGLVLVSAVFMVILIISNAAAIPSNIRLYFIGAALLAFILLVALRRHSTKEWLNNAF